MCSRNCVLSTPDYGASYTDPTSLDELHQVVGIGLAVTIDVGQASLAQAGNSHNVGSVRQNQHAPRGSCANKLQASRF